MALSVTSESLLYKTWAASDPLTYGKIDRRKLLCVAITNRNFGGCIVSNCNTNVDANY